MPNEYSIAIHDFISSRMADALTRLADAEAGGDEALISYWQGQLDEYRWLRDYFGEHTDLKGFDYYE